MRQVVCKSLHAAAANPETKDTEDEDYGTTDDKN